MASANDFKRSGTSRKLTGWKSIGRHLGRSERAVQLWEAERALPIHRIPGGPGQTVFAYVEELDRWMASESHDVPRETDGSAVVPATAQASAPRPPGILVLPFENHDLAKATSFGDAICQQLIARLAQVQRSVRVLSWQTSKTCRHRVEPLETMAASLGVRYLVEGAIDCSDGLKHVDVRIVDAELDQVLLADRFVSSPDATAGFHEQVAAAIAAHFALVHDGALVEPMCLVETTPATLLDYLRGAQRFFDNSAVANAEALAAFEQALTRDPSFVPARAMTGLALLQFAGTRIACDVEAERVRAIAAICATDTSARVTAAFLNAAIAMTFDGDRDRAEAELSRALPWLPPSIPSMGRLYERRSSLRPRLESRTIDSTPVHRMGPDLLEGLLDLLAEINRRNTARHSATAASTVLKSANASHWAVAKTTIRHDESPH